jgi:hypothetical protein
VGKQRGTRKEAHGRPAGHQAAESPAPDRTPSDCNALFRDLVQRANGGDADALNRLRRFLDRNPSLWKQAGDLAAVAERAWVELLAGPNQLVAESVRRRIAQLKNDLAGPHATTMELLLVDLIAATWLAAEHSEIQAASPATASIAQAAFRLRRAESAQKRLLRAIKMLASLRALAPTGLAPLAPLRLHEPPKKLA